MYCVIEYSRVKGEILMHRYIVKPYDSLFSIANRFGVTYTQLLAANPQILRHNYITVGQIMSIPGIPLPIAPAQLESIMSNAEGIIDDINNQDWDNAGDKVALIKSNFAELEPMMVSSIPPSLIYNINNVIINLEEEVALKNAYDSRVQANLITLYISYILDFYKTEIPSCIARLKYSARKIILNAENNNWSSANDDLDFINVVWNNFQRMIPSGHGRDINEFSQIVDSLGQFIENQDSAQTIKTANDMLDKVAALEEIF
jgi:hypothetical protein